MADSKKYRLNLRRVSVQEPDGHIAFGIGEGRHAYIWVGGARGCFGWVSGARTLEKFARALLAEVAPEERRKAKLKAKIRRRMSARLASTPPKTTAGRG